MSGEKTEKATPKRLKELRKKGTAARSPELASAVSLLVLVAVLPWTLGRLLQTLRDDLALSLSSVGTTDLDHGRAQLGRMLVDAARALAPGVAAVGAAALAAGSAVTRSAPNPSVLRPRMSRLSPKAAVKRMASVHSVADLLKNTVKLTALTAVSYGAWKAGYGTLVRGGATPEVLMTLVGASVRRLLWEAALLALLVGVADAAWQRRQFGKQSRMTKQEVSDEAKQSEGNPELKRKIRSKQLAIARSRMMQAVPKADVVLANPTHLVVALKYEAGSVAPVVVAKGADAVADRIKKVAAEAGVPILADKPLARALYRATDIGDTIPAELFRVVAEVLAVVYAAKRRGTRPTWNARSAA